MAEVVGAATARSTEERTGRPGDRSRSRAPRPRLLHALLGLLGLLLPLLLVAAPAAAHTTLLSTDPVADSVRTLPPEIVTLQFSAPVDVELGGLRVVGPDGDRVDDDTTTGDGGTTVTAEVDADEAGTYAVSWSVVSTDSHVISGSFVFHVQEEPDDGGSDARDDAADDLEDARDDLQDAREDAQDDLEDARDDGGDDPDDAPGAPTAGAGDGTGAGGPPTGTGSSADDPAGTGGSTTGDGATADGAASTGTDPAATTTSPAPTPPPTSVPAPPVDPGPGSAGPGDPSAAVSGATFATSTTVAAVRWVSRWVLLAGTTVLGGLVLFRSVVAPTATLRSRRAAQVATGAAAAILLGSVGRLLSHVAEASGSSLLEALPLLDDAVRGTEAGLHDALRILAGALALVAALLWRRAGPVVPLVAGGAVLLVMVSLALSGHPASAGAPALAVASDVVHHAAAATWIGGLAALGIVLAPAGTGADDATAGAVRRFSTVALSAVVVVAITGVASAAQQSGGDPGTLLTTRYGATLMVKLVLVAVLLGLGFWQRTRLVAAVTTSTAVFRTARVELVVLALVLGVTAMLVNTPPAREALQARSFASTVDDGNGAVDVILTPARAGGNALHLTFYDQVGSPRTVDAATATVAAPGQPPRELALQPLTGSYWVAPEVTLPAPGTWTVEVTTLGRSLEGGFTVDVTVAEAPG
ncbi:copper resistance protein CopC [Ornithinimicrobium sp. W1679]|uniref:copper resistance CopC/CopD family protein n=1 Tax=Ornithinimicrobium sp. W1679 TaxID=3418770 RepID=UPI003CEAE940